MEKNPYRTKQRPNNSYATIYERGRKAGIKQMVEFLRSHDCELDTCDMEYSTIEAKLKEWGMDEG